VTKVTGQSLYLDIQVVGVFAGCQKNLNLHIWLDLAGSGHQAIRPEYKPTSSDMGKEPDQALIRYSKL